MGLVHVTLLLELLLYSLLAQILLFCIRVEKNVRDNSTLIISVIVS